jgi:hypothetical protein
VREGTMLLCLNQKIPHILREKAYTINALVRIHNTTNKRLERVIQRNL